MPYAPRATLNNPYGPQITFRTEDVLPPTAYYISPEDRVTVWVLTYVMTQTIYIQLRLLMATGEIQLIPYSFAPAASLTWAPTYEIPPWEGYLLGALCWSDNPQRGQCFVSVQVMRSAPPDLQKAGVVLMQGYVNDLNVLSYPTTPVETAFSGRGAFLTKTQPNVIGGTPFFTTPPFTLWRVLSLNFTLVTSAAVGNRVVVFLTRDANAALLGFWPATFTQTASTSVQYGFSGGSVNAQISSYCTVAGPSEVFVPPTGSIQAFIQGVDANDQINTITMQVEEWLGA